MSKHTKGPWEAVGTYVRGPMSDGGFLIAEVPVTSVHRQADAQLIAAAPELLEALINIEDFLPFDWAFDALRGYESQDDYREAVAKVRATIAKALGESPAESPADLRMREEEGKA